MKIGIVIADDNEYLPFLEKAKAENGKETVRRNRKSVEFSFANHTIIAVLCGIGKVNAATSTAFLISDDKCDAIFNIGLSGAISHLVKEDFVAGESFVECDFDLSPFGYPLGKKPQDVYIYESNKKLLDLALKIKGVKKGKFGTGDFFLNDAVKKQLYKDTFNINAFDMETAAVASVCYNSDIPFLCIRKISDTADDESTQNYTELNNKCESDLTEIITNIIENLK